MPAPAPATEGALTIPPRPLAWGAPPGPGTGNSLASLMSGLLDGSGDRGGAGGNGSGGGGGGLMGLMGSVMQNPAFLQMAQSPAMQQMAEQVRLTSVVVMVCSGSCSCSFLLSGLLRMMFCAVGEPRKKCLPGR